MKFNNNMQFLAIVGALSACSAEPGDPVVKDLKSEATEVGATVRALKVDAESTTFSIARSQKIILDAGHTCSTVTKVEAKADSTIATCKNGETYRVVKLTEPKDMEVAMKCSAMKELDIDGGC